MQTATIYKCNNTRLKLGFGPEMYHHPDLPLGHDTSMCLSPVSSLFLLLPCLPLPPLATCLALTPTLMRTRMPVSPAAVPCTDATAAFLNEYLLKCHYKKWGVMLSLAGVYWRVNVSSYTWSTSLTR